MKKLLVIASALLLFTSILSAKEPLKDYSFIRGVCHGIYGDQEILERDLGFMDRLQLNSTRVWLNQRGYERDPEAYINRLVNYVRTCNEHGVSVMPILFNGNGLNPDMLKKEARKGCEEYVTAIVNALKDEEGLLMWDIMNEPNCNDYYLKSTGETQKQHEDEITDFVRHFIRFVRKTDPKNAITVGHMYPRFCENTNDLVDVISFHDYLETRSRIEASYVLAEEYSKKYNKPLINSEMGCLGRSNPYDMALEICEEHNVGWYVFNLVINGYWGAIHGLVYPDGTIRDPATIAALYGFYRKRDLNTSVKVNPNMEGHAQKAIKLVQEMLGGETEVFRFSQHSVDDILEAAEYCANILESAEMVPMWEPPTAKIETWRAMSKEDKEKARDEIRAFTYDLALQLKKWCEIF
ncbi:cellulase family glycosylhydrolase [Saccharicrinis sp. FJH54]|uniref:cellulase family glycosylhydrolase n=1 Tax=Saccharicrinis sp. FJH54 TaxID=3344665 RepID=UPI0035D478E3